MNAKFNLNNVVRFVLMVVVAVVMSGCFQGERRTQDGAVARFGFTAELFPSSSSDDVLVAGTETVDSYNESDKGTNAHDAGVDKEWAKASVTTTTSVGPGNSAASSNSRRYRD